jgi:hypothetical protein
MPRRAALVLVAGVALLGGCTRSVSHAYTTQAPAVRSSTTGATASPAAGPIAITGARFDVQAAGTVSKATSDATWAGVLATLNQYLDAAVLTPLRSGGPAGDLVPIFTPLAVDRVTSGPDRSAFIDEGLPATTDIRAQAAVAALTALAGSDGIVSVVAANLDLRLAGSAGGAPVTVAHTGDLVLLPDGPTWKIDAYDIRASRTFADAATSTTARS